MSTLARPAGPLPARVYWTRRLVLVALALALVFGLARLFGTGGGGGGQPSASQAGAAASSSAPSSTSSTASPTTGATALATSAAPTPTPAPPSTRRASKTPLAEPSGSCADGDVLAVPSVKEPAYAGSPVVLTMALTTKESPACTWTLSPRSFAVKVTSGSDRIWSTQECEGALLDQQVVVRRDHPATVRVAWNGQRSDPECSRTTAWAEPGYYHVTAAAFGSEPGDEQFRLGAPPRPTVTAKPKPSATSSDEPSAEPSSKPSTRPSSKASAEPSAKPSRKPAQQADRER